jgi:hypothetical protein
VGFSLRKRNSPTSQPVSGAPASNTPIQGKSPIDAISRGI